MRLTSLRTAGAAGWTWCARAERRRRCLAAALTLVLLPALVAFWRCLPTPLFDDPYASLLLDRDGGVLAASIAADEQWRFPAGEALPPKYTAAVIRFEDRHFAYHPGVDPLALARATLQNLRQRRVVSGASTLSMQVIRLSRRGVSRTYREKLIEVVQAVRLELAYSKQEILSLYAAHAPFGGNIVGLQAASRFYFAREPAQLSWAEACLLAVLPNNPALLHPGRQREALRAKRDRLLQQLHADGRLLDMDLRLALAEPLPPRAQRLPSLAPHLLTTLAQRNGAGAVFASSVDAAVQRNATRIASRHGPRLEAMGVHNLAILVLDNQSFDTLAYVGNLPGEGDAEQGRAVDIVQRPRSTGSVLKPFLYALMLEQGDLLPTTLVPDLPTQYGGFLPENYDKQYRGAVPAKQALARSLNVPAVRMLRQHGIGRFYDALRRLGLSSLTRPPDDYGLTLVLGGAEGSLWDLAEMYANLAQLARLNQAAPTAPLRRAHLLRGTADSGEVMAPLSPGAAWLTLDALQEVARPDSEQYWREFSRPRRIAWKTGTSYGLRDAWAIGSDARYTVGVWVGNASGDGRAGLTGINAAAPVLFDIFNTLPEGGWFAPPDMQLKEVTVCREDGYLANELCASEIQLAPRSSHFARQTPHFRLLHLDATRALQVHSQCAPTAAMRHQPWFILPPGQAFFYRKFHPAYRPVPPYRPDCARAANGQDRDSPIELLYPTAGTRLYIPRDLAGKRGRTVFKAAHRDPNAVLYWHLDDEFLQQTDTFHELALDIVPGVHRLTLVDSAGNRLVRQFQVLGEEAPGP